MRTKINLIACLLALIQAPVALGQVQNISPVCGIVQASFNLTTASGATTDFVFGFVPSTVIFHYGVHNVIGNSGLGTGPVASNNSVDSTAGTTWFSVQGGSAVFVANSGASSSQSAVYSALSNGSRLTWTKAGTPTGTLLITAIGCR